MHPHLSQLMSSKLAAWLAGGIVSVCALVAPDPALADARLEEARFFGSPQNPPTVHVGAEGGQWMLMKSPGITYQFSYYVKANRMLRWIYVSNGAVEITTMAPWTRGDIRDQHTAWGEGSFFLSNSQIGEDRARVLAACNELLAQGKSTAERHETFARLQLFAKVTVGGGLRGSWQPTDAFRLDGETMVKVVCEPEPARYEIVSVMLKANPSDQTCPKAHRLDVHFRRHSADEKKTDVTFRIVIDGEAGDRITLPMTKVNDTTFEATYHEKLNLDPGEHRIKIKVVGGPESEERTVTVSCPPMRITSITLRYDMGGNCPQKLVYETTKLYVTRPDSVEYRILNRGGGVEFSNRVKAWREGDQYVAVGQRVLKLGAHDAEYMARSGAAYSDWERLRVTCTSGAPAGDPQPPRGPRTDPPRTDPPRPDPPRPVSIPPAVTLPEPQREPDLHCPRGFEKIGRRCVAEPCPEGMQRKHGRCERVIVDCPRDLNRVGTACVRDPKPVPCIGGKMVRGQCVATPTSPDSSVPRHGKAALPPACGWSPSNGRS